MPKMAKEIAEHAMHLIDSGKVREHKIREIAGIHTGEPERKEQQDYRDFLRGNGSMVSKME